ncbi:MAG: acetate--CoA ligase [Phycisphaerae bacterium]|nr:acetate--CoA ligase [Phycisphaerae bacterium]
MAEGSSIESISHEQRRFVPPKDFAAAAHIRSIEDYEEQYKRSLADPDGFWAEVAADSHFFRKWDRVLQWDPPFAKWFVGATTNVSFNCLDLQLQRGRGDQTAILWEGEPVDAQGRPRDVQRITYRELHRRVCRFANALKSIGVRKGDRVTIYMPMIPELAVAMLACARIGAPHSVVFGGFSATAIVDRVNDAESHVVITADGGWRRGAIVPLKATVDEAAQASPLIRTVVVARRCGQEIAMQPGRDVWWHDIEQGASDDCPAEPLDAEHMLFLLYTSGSTGKPKGILHTTAGYMVFTAYTARLVFDLKPDDVYWCTADIGWITGHSYVVYGILQNGVTTLMYEGAPNFPEWDRFWSIIERHRVTKFYTAPTAIRAFMKQGPQWPNRRDLSSLKLLGTVGEPINPEAWMWYHAHIGTQRCPIVDTWWQTETGGILISPLPGATPTKPGSATRPLFGVDAAILDKSGQEQPANSGGYLCIRRPWPGMLRGIYGDEARFRRQYWSEIPGVYFTGDGARRDADGYFWIMGRVDDVIKVSGHRLGTAEIESVFVAHPKVAEAAVVGFPDEITGEAIAAFITLKTGIAPSPSIKDELSRHVAHTVGAIARPKVIRFTDALPKTRSGKIMRRLLRELATKGTVEGDTTTLEDFGSIARLREEES